MTNDTKNDPSPEEGDKKTPPLTEHAGKVEKDNYKDE